MGDNTKGHEKPTIITMGTPLYNQVSLCYPTEVEVILAEELNGLFQVLPASTDAMLLLDLSLFEDDVEHPAVKTIFKKGFEQRIIVFTSEQKQEKLYKLFEQGARGFCHTSISNELLVKAVQAVDEGEIWIGRKLTGYLMSRMILDKARKSGTVPDRALDNCELTLRESEIVSFVAKGKCDKIIARDLDISPNTVKNHLCHIYNKLDVANRFQLALVYHGIALQ
jgi:two-component system nitrate/nitrite response regulator NarL